MAEASFGGSVPERYDSALVPLIFEDYARDLAGRVHVPEGGRVLELACGTGVVTRHLRSLLPPSVNLVATDVNPDMMAVAERSLAGRAGVEFRLQDATNLDLADAAFDAVVCQFGVMFFPDKDRAYAEAARVLKSNGSFLFSTWEPLENNPLFQSVQDAVESLFPEDPPQFIRVPFGYHDVEAIRAAVARAGFTRVTATKESGTSRAASARDAATTFATASPLAPILAEIGTDKAVGAFEQFLAARFGRGPIESPTQAILFAAAK